jgi:Mut7-C ubiquitin
MAEPTLTITLKINHALADFVPWHMIDREMTVKVKKGACVDDVLKEVVGLSHKIIPLIFVNGHHAKPPDALKSGDRVTLWMPMAGG